MHAEEKQLAVEMLCTCFSSQHTELLSCHCLHLSRYSVWSDLSPGHQPQRPGEEGWLQKVPGDHPQGSSGGRRTLQEGTLENAEMKLGYSHLIFPSRFPWRWYSLEGGKCGNMGGLSQSRT